MRGVKRSSRVWSDTCGFLLVSGELTRPKVETEGRHRRSSLAGDKASSQVFYNRRLQRRLEESDDSGEGIIGGGLVEVRGLDIEKAVTGVFVEQPLAMVVASLRFLDLSGIDQLVVCSVEAEHRHP